MRYLVAFLVLAQCAIASDVELQTRVAIAIAQAKAKKPTPDVVTPPSVEPKPEAKPLARARQVFRQKVTRGPRPRMWNWEGLIDPTPEFAVTHLRLIHSQYLPEKVDISELEMEDLNRIHSWIHEGGHSLGNWDPGEVDPKTGVQVVVWHWTL